MLATAPAEFDPLPSARAEDLLNRRPRIGIMGEFSAGKSTLANLLLGSPALPVRVTATQLPPVWMSNGDAASHGVDLDGNRFDVDLDRLDEISLEQTQYLRIYREAEALELFDLIDFPGISDPNMPASVWQRALPLIDGVLWCTHATQAWRQSEAAAWEDMTDTLRANSLLLLTRMDRIISGADRQRVLSRVMRETRGQFAGLFPISLTRALAANDDPAIWEASGAAAFSDALLDLVDRLASGRAPLADGPGNAVEMIDEERPSSPPHLLHSIAEPGHGAKDDSARVTPRRVRIKTRTVRSLRPATEVSASIGGRDP